MKNMHRLQGTVSIVALLAVGYTGPARVARAAGTSQVGGLWALEGTGPAGLLSAHGRLGTLTIRQQGRTLGGTLQSGDRRSALSGSVSGVPPHVLLSWQMPHGGRIRFSGTLQRGTRIVGVWSDAHGDDGGAFLVRLAHP